MNMKLNKCVSCVIVDWIVGTAYTADTYHRCHNFNNILMLLGTVDKKRCTYSLSKKHGRYLP